MAGFFVAVVLATYGFADAVLVAVRPGKAWPMARCLDGSPYVYYWQGGQNPHKFFIYLEGGGECTTVEECAARAHSREGSGLPKYWPDELRHWTPHFSIDPKANPLLHDWNFIFLPYCDGGYHSGELLTPLQKGDSKVYLRGKFNVQAVMQHLAQVRGLGSATDIIIGGCSSGAIAVYTQIDHLAHTELPPKARVGGFADSGYYLCRGDCLSWTRPIAALHNISSVLNPSCVAAQHAGEGWWCTDAEKVAPFIQTPVFATQSRFDKDQLYYNQSCAKKSGKDFDLCAQSYGFNVSTSMRKWLQKRTVLHGAFIDSCFRHCSKAAVPSAVRGSTPQQALGKWWAQPQTSYLWEQNGTYPCSECCLQSDKEMVI